MHYKTIVLELLETVSGDSRAASQQAAAATDNGTLRGGTEVHPRRLEGGLWRGKPQSDEIQIASEALELALEDLQNSLLQEFGANDERNTAARWGDGIRPPSYTARVRSSRGQPLLPFDAIPEDDLPADVPELPPHRQTDSPPAPVAAA